MKKGMNKLLTSLVVLVILSPLGLLATGTAYGEWGIDELREIADCVPAGLQKWADFWTHSPLPDYSVPALGESFAAQAGGYILSAAIGVALVAGAMLMLRKWVRE